MAGVDDALVIIPETEWNGSLLEAANSDFATTLFSPAYEGSGGS